MAVSQDELLLALKRYMELDSASQYAEELSDVPSVEYLVATHGRKADFSHDVIPVLNWPQGKHK